MAGDSGNLPTGMRLGLPGDLVQRLLWNMVAGIAYLHYHKIAHRDIKCENYMLTGMDRKEYPQKIQLIDFGLASCFKRQKLKRTVGTREYMAPEVMSEASYDQKCDIW